MDLTSRYELQSVFPDKNEFGAITGLPAGNFSGVDIDKTHKMEPAIAEVLNGLVKTDVPSDVLVSVVYAYKPFRELLPSLTEIRDPPFKLEDIGKRKFPSNYNNSCFCDTVFAACFLVSTYYRRYVLDRDIYPWNQRHTFTYGDTKIGWLKTLSDQYTYYSKPKPIPSIYMLYSFTAFGLDPSFEGSSVIAMHWRKEMGLDPTQVGEALSVYEKLIDGFSLHYLKIPYIQHYPYVEDDKFKIDITSAFTLPYKDESLEKLLKDEWFREPSSRYAYLEGKGEEVASNIITVLSIPPAFCVKKNTPEGSTRYNSRLYFDQDEKVTLKLRGKSYFLKSVVVHRKDHYVLFFYLEKTWCYYNDLNGGVVVSMKDMKDKVSNVDKDYKLSIQFNGDLYFFELDPDQELQ